MLFRRRRNSPPDPLGHIDPARAPRRFAGSVANAVEARRRYQDLVEGLAPGPMRDRLGTLQTQIDAGVAAVWDAVMRGAETERVLATLNPERVTAELKEAKRSQAAPEVLAAQEARFGSVQRLLNALDDTEERLQLLDIRLGGTVARAAEVALTTPSGAEELDAQLHAVVDELGALRTALDNLAEEA